MTHDVAITGYGVLTAFGFGRQALPDGVFAGRPGFTPVTRSDPTPYRAGHAATYEGEGPEIPGVPVSPGVTPRQAGVLLACAAEVLRMAGTDGRDAPVLLGTSGDHSAAPAFWTATGERTAAAPRILDSIPAGLPELLARELALGTLAADPDVDTAPSLRGTPAGPSANRAALGSRYARFGWLAPLVAACETSCPPDGAPARPVRVPGRHAFVVEPAASRSAP